MQMEASENHFEYCKYYDNGQECSGDLLAIVRKGFDKCTECLAGGAVYTDDGFRGLRLGLEADAQDKNRDNRTYTAKSDKTEAVFLRMLVGGDRRHTCTESHNKGNGDGARRHSSRVKRRGDKVPRNEECKNESCRVEYPQKINERYSEPRSYK